MKAKFKIDEMDLGKEHIPILQKWIDDLNNECLCAGLCVPIRARKRKDYYDEWEPSTNWETEQEVQDEEE